MSSIHRQPGKPNWFCALYDPEGFRRFKSTGTANAHVARTVCGALELASELSRQGKLSEERALKLLRDTARQIGETHGKIVADRAEATLRPVVTHYVKLAGGELATFTVKGWLAAWIAGRTDASKATIIQYRHTEGLFLKWLGARADKPLSNLTPKHCEDFKLHLAARVAPSTVNKAVKILRACFNAAIARRHLDFNPMEHVSFIEADDSVERRAFTLPEIRALLNAAPVEWQTMVLVSFYAGGLRLGDCAALTWRHVDLHKGTITLTTGKTSRNQDIPIAAALAKHLESIAGDDPDAPLCPSLHGKKSSWLSGQFHAVMVKAGLAEPRNHQGRGKGRDARRDMSKVSFHSLRYSATSELKSRGVSDAVAMDIVGHETEAISRHYGRIALEAKRKAVETLPDVTI